MRLAAESTALIPERSTDPLEHVDYRLATTAEEKDKIYRLRYRAYLREGAIMPSPSERVIDQHDDAPNSWTFGIYIHGELYSSLRVTLLTSESRSSPSYEIFDDILDPELDRNRIIVDPTRFVADPEKARRFPELPYVTVRLGWLACAHFNADLGLASVRPEHRAFYRKVFLQEPLGEPRIFSGIAKAGWTDGCPLSVDFGRGCSSAFPTCVPVLSNGGCCLNARAKRTRSMRWCPRSSVPRSSHSNPDQ